VAPGTAVDLLLLPGASLSGRVSDADSRPVAGAVVLADLEQLRRPSPRVPERTDEQGSFEVLGLDPGLYRVAVRHPDFAPAVSQARVEAGSGARLDVRLERGAAVSGRLVGADGTGVRGRVSVEEMDGAGVPVTVSEVLRAEAGDDGRFRLERVPPGAHALQATGSGHAPKRIDVSVGGSAVVDLGDVELESGLAIRGRVVDKGGSPVGDARIEGFHFRFGASMGRYTAQSEPDGAFVLGGLEPGLHELRAEAAGYGPATRSVEAGADDVAIVLDPGGAITGTVVDEVGRPVRVFQAWAQPARDEGRRTVLAPFKSVTGTDGRFLIEDVAAGPYVVQVSAADRMPASVSDLNVTAGATADAGRIRLGPGGTVRGHVVDAEGAGIGGATLSVRGSERGVFGPTMTPQGLSDPGGAFEVKGVAPGMVQVTASHAAYAARASAPLEVDPARGPAEVRIVLGRGGRVEGWLRRRDGSGVPGASIRTLSRDAPGLMFSMEQSLIVTNQDGSFVIEHVPAGRTSVVHLIGSAGRYVSAHAKEIEVREGETATVELLWREILVSGRVTRAGDPASGVAVTLRGTGGGMSMSMGAVGSLPPAAGPQRRQAVTRDDGSYELIVDEPGKHFAAVSSRDGQTRWPTQTVEVPDADSFVLDLSIGGAPVSGVVVGAETGEAVARAQVWASSKPSGARAPASATTGPDGRFHLDLEPGDYRLGVSAEGYGDARSELTVGDAGVADLRLELARGLSLSGRVVDVRGRGLGGIEVWASAGKGPDGSSGWATTRPDGSFHIGGLEAGSYTLAAGHELSGFAVQRGVSPGNSVTLLLKPGGRVRVRVLDASGAPVSGVWAFVRTMGDTAIGGLLGNGGRTDAQGSAEFASPTGDVEVAARKDGAEGSAQLSVAAGRTVSAEIRLVEKGEPASR
jgi:hypothetical protein